MESMARKPLHPMLATAAVAVTLFSAAGIGAITGLIPVSRSTQDKAPSAIVEPTAKATPNVPAQWVTAQTAAQPIPEIAPPRVAKAPAVVKTADTTPVVPYPTREPATPVANQTTTTPEFVPVAAAESVTPAPMCQDCGRIEGVREVKQAGDGSGIGAVAGGVAGAVLGRQVGGGSGRTIATVVGAVGGAVAGHQIEKHVRKNVVYEVTVRMDDGSARTITETTQPTWRSGDRVRIEGGRITSAA